MGKASCHTCVYACWDLGQAMLSMSTGFASRPMCANHPDAPSRLQPTPIGRVCRNYRAKPPTPEGDVKRIPLTDGMYAYVDAADYEWLSRYHWQVCDGGYAARWEKGKLIYMHREIMKPPKGMVVDHIDGNKGNNCRFNLRICTHAENRHNQAKRRGVSSRFKGVGYSKEHEKYYAKFTHNGQVMWLGYFDDEVEAARVYDHKAVEYCGPFARVNLPEEWPPERVQEVYKPQRAKSVARKDTRPKRATHHARRDKAKGRRPGGKKAGKTRKARPARRTTKSAGR